jgi:predicted dehydrogenase
MYKCAIIGVSGDRAKGHAEAYRYVRRGNLVAVSARTRNRLDEFGETYHIKNRYTDYREMLAKERPDLVHVNTPPHVRLEIFQAAEEAGIPSLIVEKPLAIQGEDYMAMREFARACRVKIAVNHQLHFHPRRKILQDAVGEGKIGEMRFLEASARMNMAYQGTHTLQAISAFHPTGIPVSVFGQVSGSQGLTENPRQHYAPDHCLADIHYSDGVRAQLCCGTNGPVVKGERISTHKRIAVYGTNGYVHWTMHSWEMMAGGIHSSGSHEYGDEDIVGQARMTEAMFDWLEDEKAVHPLHLDASLQDFNTLLGVYMSALEHSIVELPVEPRPALVPSLRQLLGA